jgi:membrane dipeptidase
MSTQLDEETVARAAAIHKRVLTIDGHVVLPAEVGGGLGSDTPSPSQFDLVKAQRGGVDAAVLALLTSLAQPTPENRKLALNDFKVRLALVRELINSRPDEVGLATSPDELRRLKDSGKFAIVLELHNLYPFDSVDQFDEWVDAGVRIAGFTFIGSNHWADSARPYPWVLPTSIGGLSAAGREAVEYFNDRGVIVEASQLSSAAFAQLLEHSRVPVVATHSGVRGTVDTDRNFSDEELKAIGASRGLVNIVGFGPYVRTNTPELNEILANLWRENGLEVTGRLADLMSINDPKTADWDDDKFMTFLHEFHVPLELDKPIATTVDLVNAIDYAVERAGIDHVGISSDFNNGGGLADWMNESESLNITVELVRRGYEETDIAKLWGLNFLRVWDEVSAGASSEVSAAVASAERPV